MGTRNLTAVIVNGEHKIAQYGQWDGYPEGAGKEIFYFLKKIIKGNKIDVFKEKISECRFITQKELDAKYESLGIDISTGFIKIEDSRKFAEHYPQLDRNMGCSVLEYVFENGGCELMDSYKFIEDTLFCEWSYIIDFDKECLEVYGGFGPKYIASERFIDMCCYKVSFSELLHTTAPTFVKNCH